MSRFIGVDLHKNSLTVCFLTLDPEEKIFKTYSLKDLDLFLKDVTQNDVVAVESTTNTRFFVNQIADFVSEVKVINPQQFKVISESVKKTDRNDAELIAVYLSKELLPEVRLKDKEYTELESLAHTRDKLVKLRTTLKNKIHNLLSGYGIITQRECMSSEKGLNQVLSYNVSLTAKMELEIMVDEIRSLNRNIKKLDDALTEGGKKLDGHKNITSIKGIGDKSGSIILSVIGNVAHFENEKKLFAYFGIIPTVSDSNTTVKHGRITKRGSKLGRTTLVQCTLIAIRYSPYLKSFYERLKSKKGSGKAIIATAKKLLGIIYNTLKNNWVFKDFTQFELEPI